jgi:hypothetical protein
MNNADMRYYVWKLEEQGIEVHQHPNFLLQLSFLVGLSGASLGVVLSSLGTDGNTTHFPFVFYISLQVDDQ